MIGAADNGKVTIQRLNALLEGFGLKHASKALADILGQADEGRYTPREFLFSLLEAEVNERNARNRDRNYTAAHFPPNVKDLEEFDPSELESGITRSQLNQLKELGWIDTYGNLVFAGPPGLGKTMIAIGLGVKAVDEGYSVCVEKMDNLVGIMDKAEVDRAAGFRLKNIKKAQLVILDECGYTPINRAQANKFFTLISDLYERASVIITTNKEIPEWAEMMGDPVLTTAILDRLLHHARCFSFKGESYRLKHPDVFG